jgi:uncharacterized membrane protein
MKITLEQFIYLTGAVLLIYYFFETRVYLALWAAILHLIIVITKDFGFYKIIVASYVILVFISYLYVSRNVLSGKEKYDDSKFKTIQNILSEDKNKKHRIGIAFLLFLAINIIAIVICRKINP